MGQRRVHGKAFKEYLDLYIIEAYKTTKSNF